MSTSTGRLSRYDRPQSPWTRLVAHRAYWTGSGRSSPSSWEMRARSSAPIDVVSVYMASGPPGARCRRANAITVTPTSTAPPWKRRRIRYLPTTLPPGPGPPPAGAAPPPRLLRPPPRVRVPDVAHEVRVLLVVLQTRLRAFDVDVVENRQDGKVLVEDRLDLPVNRLPLLLADDGHTLFRQPVHFLVRVLGRVAAFSALHRDVARSEPVEHIGVASGLSPDVPAHRDAVELRLEEVVAPHHRRRHI